LLLDVAGRRVLDLKPGPNDVSRLPSGMYFISEWTRTSARNAHIVRKVVLLR
jgi:hypothetical protein